MERDRREWQVRFSRMMEKFDEKGMIKSRGDRLSFAV